MAGSCLSHATIDMAPTIRVREAYLGLFRPGEGLRRHNMALEHQRKRLSAYWRAISFRSVVRRAMFRARTYIAGRPQLGRFYQAHLLPGFPSWTGGCERPSAAEREDRYQAIPVRATRIGTADLTPRAHQVYLDLVKALKHGQ